MLGDTANQVVGNPDVELARIAGENVDVEHPAHSAGWVLNVNTASTSGYVPFAALRVTPTRVPADFTPPFSVLSVLSVFFNPLPVAHTPLTGHSPHFASRAVQTRAPSSMIAWLKAHAGRPRRRGL